MAVPGHKHRWSRKASPGGDFLGRCASWNELDDPRVREEANEQELGRKGAW